MATPTVDLPPTCEEEVSAPILDHAQGLVSAIGVAAVAAVAVGDGLTSGLGYTKSKAFQGHMGQEDGQIYQVEHQDAREAKQQRSLREAQEKWDAATMGAATRVETVIAADGVGGGGGGGEPEDGGGPEGVHLPPRKGADAAGQQVRAALSRTRLGRSNPSISSSGSSSNSNSNSSSGASSYNTNATTTSAAAASQSNALNFTQTGRITKSRHRASLSAPIAASLVTAAITESARLSYEAKLTAALAASIPGKMVGSHSSTTTTALPSLKANGLSSMSPTPRTNSSTPTISNSSIDKDQPVISFWGPEPIALPSRFVRIKQNLIRGHEAELEASWARLITALRKEVSHIEDLGAHLIPSIEFGDLDDSVQTARFGHDLRRYGVGVVRKVVPRADTDTAVRETVDYLDSKRHVKAKALQQHDPACFDFFWTPAQVRSRAHPNVLSAQRFMMGLWETSPDDQLVTRLPITYVDRIRVHGNSENQSNSLNVPPNEPPQSANDWIQALQSSAGITAQVDNGSLERWEPDGYQHAGTYNHIFHGKWEDYDPWKCTSRTSVTTDLYNGYGACTIFRMFQGILALSTVEPGMVRLLPSPKLATAYYLLRPFFTTKNPPPENRSGPEWEEYLAPENWKLQTEPDSIIHGAVPGHAQRITETWHPHLHLRNSMITLPTLQPGDYIFWHPDLPYYLSSNNYGLKTPSGSKSEVSMLVYIPAAPLTQTNALYLARQRKAFQRGHPGPDFDSTGRGIVEEDAETRPGEKEIAEVGGPSSLQAMGLAPWEVAGTRSGTPPPEKSKPKSEVDSEMEIDTDTKSSASTPPNSRAEAEVVRLANIILFPERSMLGYSV
ncbi:unnamed protein product [Fusarium graminearum]|uniref:Chromosome 3, complete genome n=2 Tax=Gibberella zeae TaxID=5518 RepID=I1RN15_GIBZE|nr:hypothetical protein FGSG_05373 [Fusarium graminearum PH-1]EYB30115.1 hypothetical protein FG05_05373 [Fusarium graminearum]ESU11321.1 hypothetical protein FGSG_05373 [Fusarium graminearum PH-1]KAI6757403.1 hypothetical protein HG531_003228 [Fusarium graminearum]PCD40247.1 hypothetical protein FGRA07_01518 [Fusarium graminearum]CAF3509009.1 unnamed protein product [Fusarium graminearum]|eukprot:XP_011323897.1 hypothetical protein FGSG_05373 [Fusarium graminearum PH-1]